MSSSYLHQTNWPDAAPLDGEDLIFSISCGNTHLHWATHYGDDEDYNPQIFWRTPHLDPSDFETEDLLSILSRNLPDDPHDYIFGKSIDAVAIDAINQSKKRECPLISIYVVSTNKAQEDLLAKIWSTVPSRFFVMKGEDFFRSDQGRYDKMGTDRLATLTGAVRFHGHPALVFDGGTATTYSATDCDGNIMGGGIGPGIKSKFRSLTKDASALPEISTQEVLTRVKEAQDMGKPLPTFARDTQEAMMADAFQEFAYKGRNVIEQWIEKAYRKKRRMPVDDETEKVNIDKTVFVTGGDGDILANLLQPDYGGLIEQAASSSGSKAQYQVENSKHLINYGIGHVLSSKVRDRKKKESANKTSQEMYIGKRVAKHFEVEADDGDNIFRGKVAKVNSIGGGTYDFAIHYDDGDKEDVSFEELLDMLEMFQRHGEKKPKSKKKKKAAKNEVVKPEKEADEKKTIEIPSFPMKGEKNKANGDTKPSKKLKHSDSISSVSSIVRSEDPRSFVRKRISKDFDGQTYFGTVMEYDDSETPPFWHVEYDDGDEEDYAKKDLILALKHYGKHCKDDKKKNK